MSVKLGEYYERIPCHICGNLIAANWYVQHVKSGCRVARGTPTQPRYFLCRRDNIDQVAKQLEKYWPGEFIRNE
jgi:hypothetical protein